MQKKDLPYSNKGDLTTGPVENHLIRLTVPMIWSILAVISLQLVDTYFIAMLGTEKLAAISFTFPVTMIITHLVFGLNIAMSSVVSRLAGQKKMDDVKRVTLHGIFLAVAASAVMALLCYIFLDPIFLALGADQTTLSIIRDYMPLWLIGSVFLAIPVNGNSAIRALGDAFSPAVIMIAMAALNVVLNPILIFGWAGIPALGVTGSALATLISYIFCMLAGVYLLVIKKRLLPEDGLHLDKFKDSIKRLVFIAIPAGITNIIQPATNAFIVTLLATHGPEAVAAFGVVSRVEAFALLTVMALALGMAPIVGQNWGAEIFARVHRAINLSIGFNFIWSFLVAIIFGVFARPIAGAFSSDPAVVEIAALFFWIVPVSYAFGNLVFGWGSAFNAMGMPQRAFVMIVVKALVLTLPAVFAGHMIYGIKGIFIAIACANIVSGIFFHISSWRACLMQEKNRLQTAA